MAKYYLVIKNGQVQQGAMTSDGKMPDRELYGKDVVFVETIEKTYAYVQALDCLASAKKNCSHKFRVKFLQYAQYYRKQYARLIQE